MWLWSSTPCTPSVGGGLKAPKGGHRRLPHVGKAFEERQRVKRKEPQDKNTLLGSATGMLLGIANVADWGNLRRDMGIPGGVYGAHGSDGGAAAGRVSYLLGLKGPCFSVNTACSSSLVALDAARQNLQLHTCKQAVVAGVCLHLHASSHLPYHSSLKLFLPL